MLNDYLRMPWRLPLHHFLSQGLLPVECRLWFGLAEVSLVIAMRALNFPDAFPKEDVAIRKCLGGLNPKAAEQYSQAWRPWRSYATLYLWNKL